MSDGKVRGVVHFIDETKTYGQKGFRKRLLVLEQGDDRYTNYVPLEFTNDSCDSIDDVKVGDEMEVSFRLRGRKWQRDPDSEVKYFVNAEATSYSVTSKYSTGADAGFDDDINDQLSQAADDDDDTPF